MKFEIYDAAGARWFLLEADTWGDAAILGMPFGEEHATVQVRRNGETNRFVVTREVVYNAKLVRE